LKWHPLFPDGYTRAQNFITSVNRFFPLFQPELFQEQLNNENIDVNLSSIIYTISARAMGVAHVYGCIANEAALAMLVNNATVQAGSIFEPSALNQWRTACLLAWYGFHQYPGSAQELRIAALVRKAYHYGLHQIDSMDNQTTFGWDTASLDSLEDWRHVWWCIYLLDSYSSFATAAPHLVETESIQTALLQGASAKLYDSEPKKLFLPFNRDNLWKLVQSITMSGAEQTFNLHLAVNTLLKDVVALFRLTRQNPCDSVGDSRSVLKDHLSTIQLALPRHFLRHTRNILAGESVATYNIRLQTVLKIYTIRLLVCLPSRYQDSAKWSAAWEDNLEICYQMFEVLRQWDTQAVLAVDPAVCHIVLPVLMFLHLHSKSSAISNPTLQSQLNLRKNVIRLLLQQYALHWALPRFLLASYDAFTSTVPEYVRPEDIYRLLDQFHGPLHKKWLNFLSITPEMSHSTSLEDLENSVLSTSTVSANSFETSEWMGIGGPGDNFDSI